MRYLLGAFDYPVRVAFDVVPTLNMELAKGLGVTAQLALPIYNDLDRNDYVRPGIINIHKDLIFPGSIFTNFAIGFFSRNRFGMHSTVKKYFFEERLSMGVELGYTTFTGFTGKVDYVGKENKDFPFYTFTADYYIKKYSLNFHTSAGRFLYQDEGFMMSVSRQFSETSIGFFALSTTYGSNAGFQFSFALPPRKYSKPGAVRIRPEHSFSLSYRVVGGDRIGRTYNTGANMISALPEFYPSFLLQELKTYIETVNLNRNHN
jgi:hypothetical protein